MAKNKLPTADVTEDPHYHDTWTLLRKYRDVVWSLEVSVRQVRIRFRIDYGKTIEVFLESVYLAGADLSPARNWNIRRSASSRAIKCSAL